MNNPVSFEERLVELYEQSSLHDRQILAAMVESALLVGRLLDDDDPEVAGFGPSSSVVPGLDSMSEMSEMTSLRLQMTMDRRSKFLATLSNVEAKISATAQGITQNLK